MIGQTAKEREQGRRAQARLLRTPPDPLLPGAIPPGVRFGAHNPPDPQATSRPQGVAKAVSSRAAAAP